MVRTFHFFWVVQKMINNLFRVCGFDDQDDEANAERNR